MQIVPMAIQIPVRAGCGGDGWVVVRDMALGGGGGGAGGDGRSGGNATPGTGPLTRLGRIRATPA